MEKKERRTWWVTFISTILILGAFAVAALILSNIGVRVYQNVVLANDNNFELRTSLNYVATKVRQNETYDSVTMFEKDGVEVLALGYMSEDMKYETLIYYYNGYLCEHLRDEGADFELNYGFEMIEIAGYTMELNENTLTLTAENNAGETENLILTLRTGR